VLEYAGAHPPDLVILDLGLPDMDGVDVIGGCSSATSPSTWRRSGCSG
jgi:two-component system, OmpR family, KDP operon response regulator KdpE